MKLFHISDLHIGKRVNGFSMLEDQKYILRQILELVQEHDPDGVLIAGDLYDKSTPAAEAVELVDWFLSQLAGRGVPVWVISGNHDSAERVAYGAQMLARAGVYVSRVFDGKLQGYCMERSEGGEVSIVPVCDDVAPGQSAGEGPGIVPMFDTAEVEQKPSVMRKLTAASISAKCNIPDRNTFSRQNEEAREEQNGQMERIYLWLLPYLRPAQVRRFFPSETIETTQQAVQAVLGARRLPKDGANILLMHQFLLGASVCDSEELSVGGLDQVDDSVTTDFDYVALGHLHRPQSVGRETVRYCGSPLKYSFSEARGKKSVTVVEISPVGGSYHTEITLLPLTPRLDLREIRGPIETLLQKEVYALENREDYLHITLTDQEELIDAIGRLREVYPNIMRLDFAREGEARAINEEEILLEEKSPQELFEEFFERQNGRRMTTEQSEAVAEVLEKVTGDQ